MNDFELQIVFFDRESAEISPDIKTNIPVEEKMFKIPSKKPSQDEDQVQVEILKVKILT